MQLRLRWELSHEQYVNQKAWLSASITTCPLHPKGGCGLRKCGTYERKDPAGVRIQRWYCPRGHRTFSLVPDFVATRVSSSLADIESVVVRFERLRDAGATCELAARAVGPAVEPEGALRWVARRRSWFAAALALLAGVAPQLLLGCEPTVECARRALGVECVLERAREIAAAHLAHAPPPLGFARPVRRRTANARARAHKTGPDPPPSSQ